MTNGKFYFISDDFYTKYDPNKLLMQNKESLNGVSANRQCFFAFKDNKHKNILWCIPISSKIDKYSEIYDKKIEKLKSKGKEPICKTIRFGNVMGQKRAFLIQNMFPITIDYIESKYIDKNTKKEVTIEPYLKKDIIKNAKDVLKTHFNGYNIIFGDIKNIYNLLIQELSLEFNNEELLEPQKSVDEINVKSDDKLQTKNEPVKQETFSFSNLDRKKLNNINFEDKPNTPIIKNKKTEQEIN